eukprot:Em0005g137a
MEMDVLGFQIVAVYSNKSIQKPFHLTKKKAVRTRHLKADPNPAVSSPDKESNPAVSSPDKEMAVSLDECLRLYTNEDIIDGWPLLRVSEGEEKKYCYGNTSIFNALLKRYKLDQVWTYPADPKGGGGFCTTCDAVINHYSSDHNSRGHDTTVSRCGSSGFASLVQNLTLVVSAVGRPQQPMSFFTKEMNVELKVKNYHTALKLRKWKNTIGQVKLMMMLEIGI